MKRAITAVLALLLLLGTAGCGRLGVTPGKGEESPAGAEKGYYAQGQALSGGSDLSDANLKDIRVERVGEDTVIRLSFLRGSGDAGTEEETLSAVPDYTLRSLPGLSRFELTLPGVAYWDYALYEEELGGTVLAGLLRQNALEDRPGSLIFCLTQPCEFRSEASGSRLTLYFRPKEETYAAARWYVAADGYDLFRGESQPLFRDLELYPTLCSDGTSVLLLSRAFADQTAAQTFLEQEKQTLDRLLPGRMITLVALAGADLPAYDPEAQIESLTDTAVGSVEGAPYDGARLLQSNGRFLAWMPEGGYLYARASGEGDEDGGFETLWQHRAGGDAPVLEGHEYSHILSAAFSRDGQYLAVLEQNDQLYRQVEVICLATGETCQPTDAGFGADTPAFAWDEATPVLYAISGEGEDLAYMRYDLTDPAQPRAERLPSDSVFESALAQSGDSLYFIRWDPDLAGGRLCAMPVTGGAAREIADAGSFLLSPDGRQAAVLGDTDAGSFLRLVDLSDGRVTPITQNELVLDMQWDTAGDRLYYTLYNPEAADEDLPLTLCHYDCAAGTAAPLMELVQGTLCPAAQSRRVILVYIFTRVNQTVPMTYKVELP